MHHIKRCPSFSAIDRLGRHIFVTFKRKRRRKWEVTPPTIDETPPTIDDVTDVSPPTIDDVTDMFDQWRSPVIEKNI